MKLRNKTIHLIGIGGIGMSAIARILLGKGCSVTGSDMCENEIIRRLRPECDFLSIGHKASNIGSQDLVVYSSGIRHKNAEILAAKKKGIPAIPRLELLGMLIKEKQRSVCVTGTHGKTTITAMLSCLLEVAKYDPSVLIGGEHPSFNGNAKLGKSDYLVAELDESDGMFASLKMPYLVIPNVEREHAEHYKGEKDLFDTFKKFLKAQEKSALCFYSIDERPLRKLIAVFKGKKISYGFSKLSDFQAANIKTSGLKSEFDCMHKGRKIGRFTLFVPGEHNISNAMAAIAFGYTMGIKTPVIIKAIREYRGVKRRFELVGSVNGIRIVEDYAHHPTEIKATIRAARSLNPKRIIAVFQPHSYTRTKAFTAEFSRSFDDSDRLILTDVYAAGEDKIRKVGTANIYKAIKKRRPGLAYYLKKEKIAYFVTENLKNGDLVLVLGAGDINQSAREILKRLKRKYG